MSDTSDTPGSAIATPVLPAGLRLGAAHLIVADLERATRFYTDVIGLSLTPAPEAGVDPSGEPTSSGDTATLGDGTEPAIVLRADPAAKPAGRHAGLFHVALLYPSRRELARALLRIAASRTPIQGASDHGTHEAIYLTDPDGNGLELAADRPREQWPRGLGYDRGPAPLHLDALLTEVRGEELRPRAAAGLRVGHLHLHVGDVGEGLRFYRDVLGFEEQANLGSAAFVSAGGYHHHVAFNTWRGVGVGPAPEHVAGLHHWTAVLPEAQDLVAVRARLRAAGHPVVPSSAGFETRDPWGIALRLGVA